MRQRKLSFCITIVIQTVLHVLDRNARGFYFKPPQSTFCIILDSEVKLQEKHHPPLQHNYKTTIQWLRMYFYYFIL